MDTRALAIGLAFVAMWASAFTSGKIIVEYAPPLFALGIRYVISGFAGVGIAFLLGQRARLTRAQWGATILFGLCQNTLYLGLNFLAFERVDASVAVIIASALPISVALLSWVVLREKLSPLGSAGMVAGGLGVILVMGDRLGGLAALTVATLIVRQASPGGNVLMIVGLQMLVGAVTLLPLSAALEVWEVTFNWQLAAAFTYTTVFPGLVATVTWFFLVQRIGPTRAATFHFLNPFIGVAIAALILGEALNLTDLVGVAIIMGGILAVQMSKTRA
jgi:drug/metabolite transporter (DMT)-like permease